MSTNVAETSVTIPGVKFVVDSGYVKVRKFDQRNNVEGLFVVAVS